MPADVPFRAAGDDARLQAIDVRDALRPVAVYVDAVAHPLGSDSELRIAPVPGSPAAARCALPDVVAELRPRPLRVWLPKGEFVATARADGVASPATPITGDAVQLELPR